MFQMLRLLKNVSCAQESHVYGYEYKMLNLKLSRTCQFITDYVRDLLLHSYQTSESGADACPKIHVV